MAANEPALPKPGGMGGGGPSPMKPRSLQPPHTAGRSRQSPAKPVHPDESENMNPDEVQHFTHDPPESFYRNTTGVSDMDPTLY